MIYTGYLRRDAADWPAEPGSDLPDEPYILVTTGGGGDGAALVDWVLRAYEADPALSPHALIVYGPFMNAPDRQEFDARVAALGGRITALGFHPRLERVLAEASGVVSMGGYNTFCEILSMDKPAIIAPRTQPRREQIIRATAAEDLGLARMLSSERDGNSARAMVAAIRGLSSQPRPSEVSIPGLMSGLETIAARVTATIPVFATAGE